MSYECNQGCNGCGAGIPNQSQSYATDTQSDCYSQSSHYTAEEDEKKKRYR